MSTHGKSILFFYACLIIVRGISTNMDHHIELFRPILASCPYAQRFFRSERQTQNALHAMTYPTSNGWDGPLPT